QWLRETLISVGALASDGGDKGLAGARCREALGRAQGLEENWGTPAGLFGFVGGALGIGATERGAWCVGPAGGPCQQLGRAPAPHHRFTYDGTVATTQAELGEDRFSAVHAAGRALSIDQAVAEGMALAEEIKVHHASASILSRPLHPITRGELG